MPDNEVNTLTDITNVIGVLAYASNVTLVGQSKTSGIPAGCATVTVSGNCAVSIALKDIIDVAKEIAKLTEKKKKIEAQLSTLNETVSKPDYEEKVPLGVRTNHQEKIQALTAESKQIDEAMGALKDS